MKVTGYMLREAVRRWTTVQTVAAKMFPEVTFAFFGDIKDNPLEIDTQYWTAALAVSELQEAQQKFNASIRVKVGNQEMNLSRAIKLVAFAGQRSKAWKTAACETGKSRYSDKLMVRDKDSEVAKRQMSVKECLAKQAEIDSFLADLRTAISVANGKEIDIIDLDPKLFGK